MAEENTKTTAVERPIFDTSDPEQKKAFEQYALEKIKQQVEKTGASLTPKEKEMQLDALKKIFIDGRTPREALNLNDATLNILYTHAYKLYESGKYEDALPTFKVLAVVSPSAAKYQMALAATYHKLHKYEQALQIYLTAAYIDSVSPLPLYHAADVCFKLNDNVGAYMSLNGAAQRCGDHQVYAKLKGKILAMMNGLKDKLGLENIGPAFQEEEAVVQEQITEGQTQEPSTKKKKKKKKIALNEDERMYDLKDPEQKKEFEAFALKKIKAQVEKTGANLTEKERNMQEDVLKKIFIEGKTPREAMDIDDCTLNVLYTYGYKLYESGKYAEAIPVFKMIALLSPTSAKYQMALAAGFHKNKEYERALQLYFAAAYIDTESPLPFYHAADVCLLLNDTVGAYMCLNGAAHRCGSDQTYAKLKGKIYAMMNKLKQELGLKSEEAEKGGIFDQFKEAQEQKSKAA